MMRAIGLGAVAMVICLCAGSARAQTLGGPNETALDVYNDCKTLDKTQTYGVMLLTPAEGYCWGLFTTFNDLTAVVASDGVNRILHICNSGTTQRHLLFVFLRYLETNPQFSSKLFFLVTLNALLKAYPCGPHKTG